MTEAPELLDGYKFHRGINYKVEVDGDVKNIVLQAWQMKVLVAKGAKIDLFEYTDDQKPEDVIDSVLDSIPE